MCAALMPTGIHECLPPLNGSGSPRLAFCEARGASHLHESWVASAERVRRRRDCASHSASGALRNLHAQQIRTLIASAERVRRRLDCASHSASMHHKLRVHGLDLAQSATPGPRARKSTVRLGPSSRHGCVPISPFAYTGLHPCALTGQPYD